MSQEPIRDLRANGRVIGGMSGLVFVLTLGLIQWIDLGNWDGRGLGFVVFLLIDLIVISVSAWIGGRIALSLAPPADKGVACALGILGGLVIDALFCALLGMASAAELWHFSTWLQLLGKGMTGIAWASFGAIPAIPWGIVTGLWIRASLQPNKHSQRGDSLE